MATETLQLCYAFRFYLKLVHTKTLKYEKTLKYVF